MRNILANAGHIVEFATDPKTGAWLTGTCGETALAVAIGICRGTTATQASMLAIYDDMRARGLTTAANGASTLAGVAAEARAAGMTVAVEHDYGGDSFPGVDWISLIRANAGHQPIVLQLANGQALSDIVSGVHDESGVHYHFICIVGTQDDPGAYVVADGDNPGVAGDFQHYSLGVLEAAQPCAMLILAMSTASTGATPMADPVSNGHVIPSGLGQFWLAHQELGPAIADMEYAGTFTRQLFNAGRITYDNAVPANGVYLDALGLDYQQHVAMLNTATAELAAAQAQLATANATIATLQAAAPASSPVPPSPDPVPISAADQAKIKWVDDLIAMVKGS